MRRVLRSDEYGRSRDHSTIGKLDAAQPIVFDDETRYVSVNDLYPARLELQLFGCRQVVGVDEEGEVVRPLPQELCMLDRAGTVPRTPIGSSRTSQPWQYGQ